MELVFGLVFRIHVLIQHVILSVLVITETFIHAPDSWSACTLDEGMWWTLEAERWSWPIHVEVHSAVYWLTQPLSSEYRCGCAKSSQLCPAVCDPIYCSPLCPWDSPGKNTGVGCHVLLQGIFPTQGWNQRLLTFNLHWQVGSLPRAPPEKFWGPGTEETQKSMAKSAWDEDRGSIGLTPWRGTI